MNHKLIENNFNPTVGSLEKSQTIYKMWQFSLIPIIKTNIQCFLWAFNPFDSIHAKGVSTNHKSSVFKMNKIIRIIRSILFHLTHLAQTTMKAYILMPCPMIYKWFALTLVIVELFNHLWAQYIFTPSALLPSHTVRHIQSNTEYILQTKSVTKTVYSHH